MTNTIQQLEDLKEWSKDSTRYERRLNFRGGQLVQPGPGRQGYRGDYTYTDQRRRFNVLSKKWEYKGQTTIDGKKTSKWFVQKKGESKPQFFNRMEETAGKKIKASNLKQLKETKKGQGYIDNWTTNWLDNNIDNYKLRKSDNLVNDLSKAWKSHLKKVDIPKGFKQKLSTVDGLPNVTSGGGKRIPFTYEGFNVYAGGQTERLSGQLKKMFFKNKIRTMPNLKKDLRAYFDFMNMDKRGMYNQFSGKTIKAYKDIVNKDVIYLLSPDANFSGTPKYQLFNSFDDKFNNAYNTYAEKVNKSKQWVKNANLIEKQLGLKKNYIINSMNREQRHLKKIFDVTQLPEELRYTLEHAQGVSAAAQSGDKEIMKRAVDDLIGTTVKQNQSLGWYGGGFEAQRNVLMREIVAGRNVKSNIASLNNLAKEAYTDFGLKGKMYSLKGGKLTSQPISKALTETDRFTQYFKTLAKTKEGASALTKQMATNTQLADLMKKHKLLTGKPLPPSLGGVSFMGVKGIEDFMKSGKHKGVRNFLKGEGYFILADYINNLSKGQSSQKALGKAVEVGSFGLIDLDADERALERYLRERGGYSETDITAMKDYLNYMKKFKQYETASKMMHYAEQNLGQGTESPEDIGTTWKDVKKARENLKLRENELRDLQATYEEGTTNMRLGKDVFTKAMHGLTAQEWNAPAGTWLDRGSRTRQDEGVVWNPIGALTRDIGGLFSGKMPIEFYEATIGKFPSLLDPRIKEKEKQKLIMEHPVYGFEEEFKKPEFQGALEDVQFDMGYALAGGGIAGIRRPWAVPPVSGPVPHGGGLSSQFNRVKKLTG